MYIYYLCKKGDYENPKYVGQTITSLERRLVNHRCYGKKSQTLLGRWIRSVNFEIEIVLIQECSSREDLDRMEIWWISYLKLFFKLKNLANGGHHGNSLRGAENPKARAVLQYDLEGNFIKEYRTITEASKETGIGFGKIQNCGSLERVKSGGGYQWKHKSENYPLKIEPLVKKDYTYSNERAIYQFDKKGNFIREWDNRGDAARFLNIDRFNILCALRNKFHYSFNYFWFHKENFKIEQLIECLKLKTIIEIENILTKEKLEFETKLEASLYIGYKHDTTIRNYINNEKLCKNIFKIKEYSLCEKYGETPIIKEFKKKKLI